MDDLRKLTAGDRILDYRLIESVGEGGFGEVFKAEHEVLDRVVAIKVPRNLEALSALRHEGVIQARLDHPGIVKTLEISISHDPPYVVMEYVTGGTLRQRLDKGALDWREATELMIAICEAVEHAHDHGVVHGDLKPGNVLLPPSPELTGTGHHSTARHAKAPHAKAKVTDFGLGRVVERPGQNLQISRSLNYVESSTGIAGTLRYLAPEVQRGETAQASADIYSLGVMLFEMLTGSLPEGRELPSDLVDELPETLDDAFSRCYVRKKRRMATVRELRLQLEAALRPDAGPDEASEDDPVLTPIEITDEPEAAPPACAADDDARHAIAGLDLPFPPADPADREGAAAYGPDCLASSEPARPALDLGAPTLEARARGFHRFQDRLWSPVTAAVCSLDGVESLPSHGFDAGFGVVTDGEPQHRVFVTALPWIDVDSVRRFTEKATEVFEAEKGLWEKEVTFVIATHEVREPDRVDWLLRSFATGWWRRRRVVLYDLTNETLVASEYGCDPHDNVLKGVVIEQVRSVNRALIEEREALAERCLLAQRRTANLGTTLTLVSTVFLMAAGLAFNDNAGCRPGSTVKPISAEVEGELEDGGPFIGPAADKPGADAFGQRRGERAANRTAPDDKHRSLDRDAHPADLELPVKSVR